jgi:hypothetical protein
MKLRGENRSTRGETCPSATFSTINLTWTDPGSNPGLRGGRQAANRLSHGTACRHIARICNTYLFFKAIICTRKRLNVTFVHTVPVLFDFMSKQKKRNPCYRIALQPTRNLKWRYNPAYCVHRYGKTCFTTPCTFADSPPHVD